MNYSYINLLQTIELFSSSHLQVKKFASDFPSELPNLATEGDNYPAIFVSPSASVFDANIRTFDIEVYCYDIIQKDRSNINYILSDTSLILSDLKIWLDKADLAGIDIAITAPAIPINNALLDYVAGWVMTLTVELDTYSVCDIPFNGFPIVSGMCNNVIYANLLTCDALETCPTIIQIEQDIDALKALTGDTTGDTITVWTTGSTGNFSIKAVNDTGVDATGDYAIGSGRDSKAFGEASFAGGINSTAINETAFAFGDGCIASGESSVAMGDSCEANNFASIALGEATTASGLWSFAEGNSTDAIGDGSHAQNRGTSAVGNYSHAGGRNTIANGINSFIHGSGSTVNGANSIVLGANIIGNSNNTTYVDHLNIKNVPAGTPVNNLAIDTNGNVITATGTTPNTRTLNINGNSFDLSADRTWRVAEADTGVLSYAGAVSASPTTINVGSANGFIIDNLSNVNVPSYTQVLFAGQSGVTIAVTGSNATYILLNSAGNLVTQTSYPTSAQRKALIYLSKVGHPNGAITYVIDEPDYINSPLAQTRDLSFALQYINNGIMAFPNTGLTFNTSAGVIYGNGINYVDDPYNPNFLNVLAQFPNSFTYRNQTGGTETATTILDPTTYDVSGVTTPVPSTASTVQYLYFVPGAGYGLQRGQFLYSSFLEALANVGKEAFVVYDNFQQNAILIGVILMQSTGTSVTNSNEFRFLKADKLGQLFGGSAGGSSTSTTDLQTAYDNSVQPQITVNPTNGTLIIKGFGNPNFDVIAVQDVTNELTFRVTEKGDVYGRNNAVFGSGHSISGQSLLVNGVGNSANTAVTNSLIVGKNNTVTNNNDGGNGFNGIIAGWSNTVDSALYSLVVGAFNNVGVTNGSIIAGGSNIAPGNGFANYVFGDLITLGASSARNTVFGEQHNVDGTENVVYGTSNSVGGSYSLIGGNLNVAGGNFTNSIVAGSNNNSDALSSLIVGQNNTMDSAVNHSIIFGDGNVSNQSSTVPFVNSLIGGTLNNIIGATSFNNNDNVIAGRNNTIDSLGESLLMGNTNNVINSTNDLIAGANNTINGCANSIIVGDTNTHIGSNSIIIGNNNIDNGGTENSFIGGQRNQFYGRGNLAVGEDNFVGDICNIGAGRNNQVGGQGNIGIGDGNVVVGQGNFGGGQGNTVVGKFGVVVGTGNNYDGNSDNTIMAGTGNNTFAQFNNSLIFGADNVGFISSFGNGGNNNIFGGSTNRMALCNNALMLASNSTMVYADNSFLMGEASTTNSPRTFTFGDNNTTIGEKSTIIGHNNSMNANVQNVIIGDSNSMVNNITQTVIIGYGNGLGDLNPVTINNCFVAGNANVMFNGQTSFIYGFQNTIQSADYSTIGGRNNTVNSSFNSLVGGANNIINGATNSILYGDTSEANANNVFVFGANIIANDPDKTYVDQLKIKTIQAGTPIGNLGFDIDGNVVTGTTGGDSGIWTLLGEDNKSIRMAFATNVVGGGIFSLFTGDDLICNDSDYSIIGGASNNVDADSSLVVGLGNTVVGNYNLVGGLNNNSTNIQTSIVTGNQNITANLNNCLVNGILQDISNSSESLITGNDIRAFAIGDTIIAGVTNEIDFLFASVVAGFNSTFNTINQSILAGNFNTIIGVNDSIVGGNNNNVTSVSSSIIGGQSNTVTGDFNSVFGDGNNVNALEAYVGGRNNTINGGSALNFIHGLGNAVNGGGSTIFFGHNNTLTDGSWNFIAGGLNTNNGNYNSILGFNNTVAGEKNHAEGEGNTLAPTSYASHVEGRSNTVNWTGSHAEGNSNTADADVTHVGGNGNLVAGTYSFVHSNSSQLFGVNSAILGGVGIIGNANETVYVPDFVLKRSAIPPTSAGDGIGEPGSITWDDTYFYVKTNTGWGRVLLDYAW